MASAFNEEREARIATLTRRFADVGDRDPTFSAKLEVKDDWPYLACQLFLRGLWQEIVLPYSRNPWVEGKYEGPVSRMRALGVSDEDISRLAASVALSSILMVLQRLDNGYDDAFESGYPGWRVMETAEPGGELTGRAIDSLLDNMLIIEPAAAEDIAAGFDKPERPKA